MLETEVPSPTWEKREGQPVGGEERRIVPLTTVISDRATYYSGNTEVPLITMAPAHTFGDMDIGFFYVAWRLS